MGPFKNSLGLNKNPKRFGKFPKRNWNPNFFEELKRMGNFK